MLATASEKGTLIRLYNADTGNRFQVLRRGIEKASIPLLKLFHISLLICRVSRDEEYVLCISENKTLHVFKVSESSNFL